MEKERLLTEILLDIEGHKGTLEIAKKEVAKARATVAFWEAHVCSHSAILRDLYKEYSERTGEPVKEVDDFCFDVSPALLWHSMDERPKDDSQILIVDEDGWGTAGRYDADCDFLAAAAGGLADNWDASSQDSWAYIKDLMPKKEATK